VTHASLSIIRHEHHALSAMLRSITLLLGEHRRHGTLPDFAALRAMLFYVDEFPEKLHHPNETRLLFPRLRGLSAHADSVLDRLERDHAHGEHAIRELEHALIAFEMMAETNQRQARHEAFEAAVNRYVDFYLEHMRIEETEVLPLAESALSDSDWAELDAAFLAHRDPLTGHEAAEIYRPLFRKILRLLPGSSSLGSALEALAGSGLSKFHEPTK
jgi:hemerythrin-like domain-containing protein